MIASTFEWYNADRNRATRVIRLSCRLNARGKRITPRMHARAVTSPFRSSCAATTVASAARCTAATAVSVGSRQLFRRSLFGHVHRAMSTSSTGCQFFVLFTSLRRVFHPNSPVIHRFIIDHRHCTASEMLQVPGDSNIG